MPLAKVKLANCSGILLIHPEESCTLDLINIFMAAGRNVKVKIKAKNIPTDIIFPNSITGLISPIIKDKNAIPVVKAAKKHGATI